MEYVINDIAIEPMIITSINDIPTSMVAVGAVKGGGDVGDTSPTKNV